MVPLAADDIKKYRYGAPGIDLEGTKHPLALVEGSTEHATVVTDLLVGLRERGLDVTRPILVGIDGAKALRKGVVDVFDHPVIQRCQLHKIRNVADRLPERLRGPVGRRRGRPTTPTPPWRPRRSWPRWPANWTRPTPVRPPARARA